MSRTNLWLILLVSSTVSLISLLSVLEDDSGGNRDWAQHEKWIVAVASISIGMAGLGVLVTFMRPYSSLKLEMPLIFLALGIWAAGMPALLDPNNDLAVNPSYGIGNANLYFFGWAALASSVVLTGNWLKEYKGDEASPVTLKWITLCATSLTVMGTASGLYIDVNCSANEEAFETYCTRTNFAIYGAVGSAIAAFGMTFLKSYFLHFFAGLGMMVLWCCGVAYLTFGDGPGTTLGNIYFATWISFFLAMNLTTTSFRYMRGKGDEEDNKDGGKAAKLAPDGATPDEEEVQK